MTLKNQLGQPIGFPVTPWQKAKVPTREDNIGEHVTLKCIVDTQACNALFNAYASDTDGKNWTYLPYGPFKQQSDFVDWFESTCLADDPLFHVVYDNLSKSPVGLASYLRVNPDAGSIEVGHIHFSPLLQRTPMATEAMYLMMRRVFDELDFRRYEWKCDALNEPSKRAALRLGFTYEGTFRQATTYKKRNRDTAWFSITDKEWPKIKSGFERWLQAGNFTEKGEQIKSLEACRNEV